MRFSLGWLTSPASVSLRLSKAGLDSTGEGSSSVILLLLSLHIFWSSSFVILQCPSPVFLLLLLLLLVPFYFLFLFVFFLFSFYFTFSFWRVNHVIGESFPTPFCCNSNWCQFIRPPIDRFKTLQFYSFDDIYQCGLHHGFTGKSMELWCCSFAVYHLFSNMNYQVVRKFA